jgi:hypothetical protein
MDEATIRRIIREELDNYDRDKGITPRRSKEGVYASPFNYTPAYASTESQPTPPKVRTQE